MKINNKINIKEILDNPGFFDFTREEVFALKDYFLKREKLFELAILVGIVGAFFIGLAIN